jgi:hypothetical protein
MSRRADPRKQQFWLEHCRRCQSSHLSVHDYCQRHGLGEASFYAWKRTLQRRGLLTTGSPQATAKAPFFVPVTVAAATTSGAGGIDLVLPDGLTVRVAAGFDATTLRQLLALLREQPC